MNRFCVGCFIMLVVSFVDVRPGVAQGIAGMAVEIKAQGTGATNPGLTLYALDGGVANLLPPGSAATGSTAWTGASSGSDPTFSLGTFLSTDTLSLEGGSILTYGGIDSGMLLYGIVNVSPGGLDVLSLPTTITNAGGVTGNILYSTEGAGINLPSGLAPGDYELEVLGFGMDADANGYFDANSNYAYYGASFTVETADSNVTSDSNVSTNTEVAPEPATWNLVLAGAGLAMFCRRRIARGQG